MDESTAERFGAHAVHQARTVLQHAGPDHLGFRLNALCITKYPYSPRIAARLYTGEYADILAAQGRVDGAMKYLLKVMACSCHPYG